ncbi:MAG: hypothetical protein WCC69_12930 [Pirellulales bacterium]
MHAIRTVVISSPFIALLVAGILAPTPAAAAQPEVIAIVAVDGYADLKQQVRWIGTLVGNPALDGFAESFIMMATQFKGLAGLDVDRPAGIIVTTADGVPAVNGYAPVKDLSKLLAALVGVVGPAEKADGGWRLAPPGGMPLQVVEKDGWAIFSAAGGSSPLADPSAALAPLVKSFTLGAQVFPSRMPDNLRELLRKGLEQAADQAAAQGQPVDREMLIAALDNLKTTESLSLGANIDMDKKRVYLESRTTMVPGSVAADLWTDVSKAEATVGAAKADDGKPLAVRAHHAQAVPDAARAALELGLAQAMPDADADPLSRAAFGVVRDVLTAMLDAGGIDAGISIDTSTTTADKLLPAFTAGMRIKDGPALEEAVKARLGKGDALPPNVKVAFDAGKEAVANLHRITIDLTGLPNADKFGNTVELTLAVTPTYAFLMTGDEIPARLAAAIAASGKPNGTAKPLTGVDLSLPALLGYAAKIGRVFSPGMTNTEQLDAVAEKAADKSDALVQLLVRPIERGVAIRLSADAGVIETIATSVAPEPGPAGLPGAGALPGAGRLPGVPLPGLAP